MRIPREFEFSATEVIISKDGDKLILEPVAPRGRLLSVLARLEPWTEEFPDWDEGQQPLDTPEV